MSKVNTVEKAIEILKWAIKNKKTLTDSCRHFNASEKTIRTVRKHLHNTSDTSLIEEFTRIYTVFVNKEGAEIKKEELLGKNDIVTKEETKFLKDTGILDARGQRHVKTLEQLLGEAKVDMNIWEVSDHVVNKWDVTTGEGNTYQNWQVKAWLKRLKTEKEIDDFDKFLVHINKAAPKYKPFSLKLKKQKKKYSFELSLPDLHVGKLSWSPETGEDYDTKIAIERYNSAIVELIRHIELIKDEVEEILLPIGNDLFNIDNFRNETSNGTPQHVDSRWQKMFLKTQEMLIKNIDYLRTIAPVKVLMVSGNHDCQTVFYLGESLKSWYRTANNVTIDNSPSLMKSYSYGENLIVFTHGNEEKHTDLGMIIANRYADLWAKCKFRQVHLGHFHKKKETKWVDSDEYPGFKVKILPSLSAVDSWHAKKGYSANRGAVGILYHKEKGLIAEYTYNVE